MPTNWAGNYTYTAPHWYEPERPDTLPALLRAHRQLRVAGTRHSFHGIADAAEAVLSTEHLPKTITIDRAAQQVTVSPAVRYGDLGLVLHTAGFALPNLASLPHISVVGACATATHGSGETVGNLATSVAALELLTARGETVRLTRSEGGLVVHLGALGMVTALTLDLVPTFSVRQDVYEHLPWEALEAHFDAIQASAYSVSLFTDWQHDSIDQVWLKRITTAEDTTPAPPTFFGAVRAGQDRHPLSALSAESCTPQHGQPGPWFERLPHFRLEFTPSKGEELQSEYFVPREEALPALRAIAALGPLLAPQLLISEVRTIAADDLWLSPAYRQPIVGIHFTWKRDWPAVAALLPRIEAALAPFGPTPHWGKLFTLGPERIRPSYPRLGDFQEVRRQLDPDGVFHNAFLEATIGPT